MRLSEPMTTITDYLLAALGFVLADLLYMQWTVNTERPVILWAIGFLMTAIGAVLGGTSHGFAHALTEPQKKFIWRATTYAVGIASFTMLTAAILAVVPSSIRTWFLVAAALKSLVYFVWITRDSWFLWVMVDYAVSMVVVLGLALYAVFALGQGMQWWIVAGVLVSFGAAGVQRARIGFHKHFNHNDLYHVIQMVGMVLLFVGGRAYTLAA